MVPMIQVEREREEEGGQCESVGVEVRGYSVG